MTNYLIDFEQDATEEQIQAYFNKHGCTQVHVFNNFDKVYLVSAEHEPAKESIVTSVINDSQTIITPLSDTAVSIESYNAASISVSDDKNWWKVVTYVNVDFTKPSLDFKKFGDKITVYVLDSGIDLAHPEFDGENVSQIYSFNGNPIDVNGHGTAIASLITGKNTALTSCKVISLKIFEQGIPTPLSKLLEALDLVYTHSATQNCAIVNMSWGIPYNEYVNNKIKQMYYGANIAFVAAAGNNGSPITDITPACVDEVFVVGAFNKNLEPCDFSNYTSDLANTPQGVNHGELDVWAPGESIFVALPNNSYGSVSGTSFSAAIHTGALAADADIMFSISEDSLLPKDILLSQLFVSGFSRGRPGLLELSGVYSNSENLITCVYPIDAHSRTFILPNRIKVVADTDTYELILTQTNCKSLRLLNQLPPGLSLSQYGYIVGKHAALTIGENYKTYPLGIEYTLNDGSLMTKNYDLYVVAPTIKAEDVPEELLWITEFGVNCSEFQFNCNTRCPSGNNIALRACWNYNFKPGGCEYCCTAANCCFTPYTKIKLADQSEKEIKDIMVGDRILYYDVQHKMFSHKEVGCVITRTERPMYKISLANGVVIEASEDHPLYVINKGWSAVVPPNIYKDLSHVHTLMVGDKVLDINQTPTEVLSIETFDYPDTVYELDTSGFFANGILAY